MPERDKYKGQETAESSHTPANPEATATDKEADELLRSLREKWQEVERARAELEVANAKVAKMREQYIADARQFLPLGGIQFEAVFNEAAIASEPPYSTDILRRDAPTAGLRAIIEMSSHQDLLKASQEVYAAIRQLTSAEESYAQTFLRPFEELQDRVKLLEKVSKSE